MARNGTPSFVRDPDQAAELAALLEDSAETLQQDYQDGRDLSRAERARFEQTIARYRRWANELSPDSVAQPVEQPRPIHIRPAASGA